MSLDVLRRAIPGALAQGCRVRALPMLATWLLAACVSGPPQPVPMGTSDPTTVLSPKPSQGRPGSAANSVGRLNGRDIVTDSDESETAKRARIRVELAAAYFGQSQYLTALDEVKRALAVDPDYVPALNLRGLIYASMGEFELAESSFVAALQRRAQDADTLHNYGWYLCQRRRFPEARRQFEAAMAVPQYRESSRTLLAAGICEARAGELGTAKIILQRSFEQDPSNPAISYNLADVLMRLGEWERAYFYVQRLNQAPEWMSPETLWLAIRIQHRRKMQASVEELGERLRARFPKSREAAAYERGQFDE